MIETHDLSKQFHDFLAVDGVNLNVQAGQILALLGQNGAGKSSLFKLIMGELKPQSGRVSLDRGATVAIGRQTIPRPMRGGKRAGRIPGIRDKNRGFQRTPASTTKQSRPLQEYVATGGRTARRKLRRRASIGWTIAICCRYLSQTQRPTPGQTTCTIRSLCSPAWRIPQRGNCPTSSAMYSRRAARGIAL